MFRGRGTAWARAALAVVAGTAMAFTATPATAEGPATGVPTSVKGSGVTLKLNGEKKTVSSLQLTVGGKTVPAFCIDYRTLVALNTEYGEGTWDASQVPNLGKVQWVLTHGYPNAEAQDLLAAAKATVPASVPKADVWRLLYFGTQTAIWHFSDGVQLDDWETGRGLLDQGQYTVIQKIRDYLVANATDQPEPKPHLTIDPADGGRATVGGKAGPFTVSGPAGEITLTVKGGTAVDADGKPVATTHNGGKFWLKGTDATGTVTVTAKGSGSVSFGRVFLVRRTAPAQKLILGGSLGSPLTATVKASFVPAPATPTAAPTPTAGGGLPVTGSATLAIALVGGALLIGGAVAVLMVRRRRVRFTA